MPYTLAKVVCIRSKSFKEKIKLVQVYKYKGYKVEVIEDKFIYAERGV
ncbi:hypothetical protein [Clostridium thailandense]